MLQPLQSYTIAPYSDCNTEALTIILIRLTIVLLVGQGDLDQECQTRGPRDDSKIVNEFRQYCNVSSSNKRLNS